MATDADFGDRDEIMEPPREPFRKSRRIFGEQAGVAITLHRLKLQL